VACTEGCSRSRAERFRAAQFRAAQFRAARFSAAAGAELRGGIEQHRGQASYGRRI